MKNNNKPFMMNPGSREINTPGVFRKDSKAMMFKMEKEKDNIKEFTPEMKQQARLGGSGAMGIIGGTAGRVVKAFAGAAKQYLRGFKKSAPKPTTTFKPFHRGGKVYDRQAINDAFKARFNPQSQQTIRPPKSPGTNMGRPDAVVKMREAYRNLKKLKK